MIPGVKTRFKTRVGGDYLEIPVDPVILKAAHILIHRANRQVEWALKRNEISKPTRCSRCNRPFPKFDGRRGWEAHHVSYSPDLRPGQEIEWLCPKCHDAKEKEIKKLARELLTDKRFTPAKLRFGGGYQHRKRAKK